MYVCAFKLSLDLNILCCYAYTRPSNPFRDNSLMELQVWKNTITFKNKMLYIEHRVRCRPYQANTLYKQSYILNFEYFRFAVYKKNRGQDMPRIFTLYFITVLFLKCILFWGRYIRAIFFFTFKINKTVSIRSTSYKVQLFEESVMSVKENKKSELGYSHGKH